MDPLYKIAMTKWPSVVVERRSSFPSFVSDRGQRIFSFQAVRSPRGCPAWTERGNGHRTSSPTVDGGHPLEVPRLISTNRSWEPVKGRRGSPRPRATPGFFPDLPPFPVAINAYGSATVRPYVGAVKRVALPIVALAINRPGAPYFHRGRIDCSARFWPH